MLTTLAEFPGLIITAVIIEWLGRKMTIGLEFLVFSLFTFVLFLCLQRCVTPSDSLFTHARAFVCSEVLTVFVFVARAFISGAFQGAYVYTPEVYPTTTRAIGVGCCSGMARVGAIITPFVAIVGDARACARIHVHRWPPSSQ
jgi:MFS family permease